MKQILVIVPFPMSDNELASRQEQLKAVSLNPEMQFTFRPVKAAPRNYVSQVDLALADLSIFEAGATAETEGFDAVCIDTMSDSGVDALRSVLSIPVIGPGRSSILLAMMLGKKFSIITMWQKWRHLYEKTLRDLDLKSACASIRSIDVAPDNLGLLAGKEDQIFSLAGSPGASRYRTRRRRRDIARLHHNAPGAFLSTEHARRPRNQPWPSDI